MAAAAVVIALALGAGALWMAGRRSTAPRPERPPLSLLIADFRNETGDPVFEGTLESTFGLAMEGASFVTLFDRGQARRVAGQLRPGTTRVDEELALLVARREGTDAVLAATVAAQGGGYRIEARLLDAASGRPLARSEKGVATKSDALPAVTRMAADLRRALGDRTPESAQLAAAETFSTASLPAAHHYAVAQEALWTGRSDDAIREYTSALELDPDLGRAYAGLAVIHANRQQRAEAEKYYELAFSKIDRMSEREKHRTRGGYYLMVRNYPRAIEEFSALIGKYPADTGALYNLALARFFSRDMRRAVEEGRRAIERYPKHTFYRANVALFAMYAGDFADAAGQAKAVLAESPSYIGPAVALALSELALGHPERAAEEYRRLSTVSPRGASVAAVGLADLAAYEGRLADAEGILAEGITSGRRQQERRGGGPEAGHAGTGPPPAGEQGGRARGRRPRRGGQPAGERPLRGGKRLRGRRPCAPGPRPRRGAGLTPGAGPPSVRAADRGRDRPGKRQPPRGRAPLPGVRRHRRHLARALRPRPRPRGGRRLRRGPLGARALPRPEGRGDRGLPRRPSQLPSPFRPSTTTSAGPRKASAARRRRSPTRRSSRSRRPTRTPSSGRPGAAWPRGESGGSRRAPASSPSRCARCCPMDTSVQVPGRKAQVRHDIGDVALSGGDSEVDSPVVVSQLG